MSTMMATVEKWEDRYLTQMKEVEEPVLRFAGDMSERVAKFVPERPAFMAEMPKMAEFVESQLKFRKRFVDEQLRFARKLMKAMDPVVARLDAEPTAPVARPTPVTRTASRRPTRKAA